MNTAKKQKQKPGHVVRVRPRVWKLIESKRRAKETIAACIERLFGSVGHEGRLYYILPESKVVCESIEEARGAAVLISVRTKKRPIEKPVAVKVVE